MQLWNFGNYSLLKWEKILIKSHIIKQQNIS